MKTEHALARELKKAMSSQPLDSISVSKLSEKCGVSRKTFYYHYHDIYDLLTQVFLDERISSVASANNYRDLITIVWKYYKSNEGFVNATLQSAGKDLFLEFIYNIFYTSTMRFINLTEESKKLHLNEKKSIARFYASGYSSSIIYYLTNYKNKTLDGLLKCFEFIGPINLENSVKKAAKMGEK